MFKHNLLITLRSFRRNKTSFIINLIGLSAGLTCVFLIYLWVNDEFHMDQFHEKDNRLYQIMQNHHRKAGIDTGESTPALLADALADALPEIKYATTINGRYYFQKEGLLSDGQLRVKSKGIVAGPEFFNIFSYKLTQGDEGLALADKNNVVISESLAHKLFNTTENVIGRTVTWEHKLFEWEENFFEGTFQVSGIFKNTPIHSTRQFDLVFNLAVLLDNVAETKQWNTDAAETFVVLKKDADVDQFNKKLAVFFENTEHREHCTLFAQQYSERYLFGQFENGIQAGGRIEYVRLFSLIGLFLLIIACVNFMNLSTAKASTRLKEVGVKKTTGASRKTLIIQFLGESITMVALSALVAFWLISLILTHFNAFTGKQLSLSLDGIAIVTIAGIVLFTGLLAGSYPAFYLSAFNPVSVLKGKIHLSLGEKWVRKGLVIFQFTLSIIFIIGFLILHRQIEFTQKKHLGLEKDHVLTFVSKGKNSQQVPSFVSQLQHIPGVESVTNIWGWEGSFFRNIGYGAPPSWEGRTEEQKYRVSRPHFGYDFAETLGLEMVAGRSFSREYSDEASKIVVNEAAAAMMGFDDPVGKMVSYDEDLEIIGVVKNFHDESFREEIKPCFIRFTEDGKKILVKVRSDDQAATIQRLKKAYEAFHPGYPFEFSFLDEEFQALYDAETKVAGLAKYLALFAIIISCLGLFGLAMFTAERRKKEIGIRKVLGSSIFGIVRMLSKDFIRTVLIALVIAMPITYVVSKNWLANFAYKMDLVWWMFFGPAILVLLIAWCTVGIQTIRAARANPVHCLHDE